MTHDTNSTSRDARRARCPESVLGWIPWYADGGLTAREKGAVEAHAAECGDCRAELDIVAGMPWSFDGIELPDADRLFGEIRSRIESGARGDRATVIPISRGRALSGEDMVRIEQWVLDPGSELEAEALDDGVAERIQEGEIRPRETQRVERRRWRESSTVWAAAAAVALLAIGALGGGVFERLRGGLDAEGAGDSVSTAYQLASVPPTADALAPAPMLDVVFNDSATARDIWSSLRELGVEVVAGPTNLGVYRLRLTAAAAEGREPTSADAAAIAARLVAPGSAVAIFAEPVP
jgi:hypothetical protein